MNTIDNWEDNLLAVKRLPLILGLTGPAKVGKTLVAQTLSAKYGFAHIDLNDEVYNYARIMGLDAANWSVIAKVALNLRQLQGTDYLVRKAFEIIAKNIESWDKIVIDSIRHPAEAAYLKMFPCSFLIGLDSSLEVRQRNTMRWEHLSLEILEERDDFEQYSHDRKDLFAPNISQCLSMTDQVLKIDSDSSQSRLLDSLRDLLKVYT